MENIFTYKQSLKFTFSYRIVGLFILGPNTSISSTPGKVSVTPEVKSSPSISTVISLLLTLCRGSPTITHDLLRMELPHAIECGLKGDERWVLLSVRNYLNKKLLTYLRASSSLRIKIR